MSSREKVLVAIIAILILAGVIGSVWYLGSSKGRSKADSVPTAVSPTTNTESPVVKPGSSNPDTAPSTADSKVTLKLKPGNNLVTIPYILSPNDGKTVFSGLNSKNAYYLDQDGSWKSYFSGGSITPGQGIWIVTDEAQTLVLPVLATENDSSKPYSISLSKGWNAIGNPYNKEIVWNPVVKTAKGKTSFARAVKANILSVAYYADTVNKVYKILRVGSKVKPFTGILIKSGGDKVELMFSAE